MLRRTIAVLIATVPLYASTSPLALESAKPEGDPPSSLEPGAPRGKVRVTHRNRKIRSCYLHKKKSGKLRCRSRREDAPSGATVAIHPVNADGVSEDDGRAPVTVDFPNDAGRQQKWLELAVGDWEVRWGPKPYKRFRVSDGDEFKVWFRTVTGKCVLGKKTRECTLSPSDRSQRVVIQSGRESR